MKRIVVFISVMLFGLSAIVAQSGDLTLTTEGDQKVEWEETTVNLGTIEYRNPTDAVFVLKNTGKVPVFITNVKPSCGCTAVDYPKQPIKPNEKVEIKVKYNAASKGGFTKSVRVTIKDEPTPHMLYIKGKVEEKTV